MFNSKLFIVDSHNKVLSAWSECRKNLSIAPRLLTLDHHTDTSKPFRKILKDHPDEEKLRKQWLSEINFHDQESILTAISRLSNDEHIVAAIQCDIISSAFVIAHNAANTDMATFEQHAIACRTVTDPSQVLETEFLGGCISDFEKILGAHLLSEPYVLDIDLDYFNTKQSVNPHDATKFKRLIEGATIITLATEPEYVEHCRTEEGITSDWLMESLSKFL